MDHFSGFMTTTHTSVAHHHHLLIVVAKYELFYIDTRTKGDIFHLHVISSDEYVSAPPSIILYVVHIL